MGHNTKLAGHHVQLRITLTRLTSDYRGEQPYCSTQGEPKRRVHLSTCQLPPVSLSRRFLSSVYSRVHAVHLSIYSPDLMCITRDRFRVIRHNAFENHFPSRDPTQRPFFHLHPRRDGCPLSRFAEGAISKWREIELESVSTRQFCLPLLTVGIHVYTIDFALCLAIRIRFYCTLHCSFVDRSCIRSVHVIFIFCTCNIQVCILEEFQIIFFR